jgi:hypothetical protein
LFDPLPISGIALMFKLVPDDLENVTRWKKLARYAKRNGLSNSRAMNSQGKGESLFDPDKIASWLVMAGKLDRARADRILRNNLPARSAHLAEYYPSTQA